LRSGDDSPPLRFDGLADHWSQREDTDYYSQLGKLFRLMNAEQKTELFGNTGQAMGDAPREVKISHITNGLKADPS
jgi:catalase